MSDLTDDEFALLEIASHGESMIPIGRWEKPLKSLAAKGMMFANDSVNYVITDSGMAALGGHKQSVDTGWAKTFIAVNNKRVVDRNSANKSAGAYIVQGQLFFKLLDGSTVLCNCIKEPYASKIVELFNDRNTQKARPGRSVVPQQR